MRFDAAGRDLSAVTSWERQPLNFGVPADADQSEDSEERSK